MKEKGAGGGIGLFETLLKKCWEIGTQTTRSVSDRRANQNINTDLASGYIFDDFWQIAAHFQYVVH